MESCGKLQRPCVLRSCCRHVLPHVDDGRDLGQSLLWGALRVSLADQSSGLKMGRKEEALQVGGGVLGSCQGWGDPARAGEIVLCPGKQPPGGGSLRPPGVSAMESLCMASAWTVRLSSWFCPRPGSMKGNMPGMTKVKRPWGDTGWGCGRCRPGGGWCWGVCHWGQRSQEP